jgi:hypothetical protein
MNEKRMKRRNNQTDKRKRLILERSAPDYHEIINYQEHWDEVIVRRHSPHGIRETTITLFMCPDKIDSHYLMRDGYMKLINKRPDRMGSYKIGEYIGKLLGRRGRFE